MEQTLRYAPTGRIIVTNNDGTEIFVTDNRLTVIGLDYQNGNLIVGTTTLLDKQGDIKLDGNDLIIFRPRVSVGAIKSYQVDGDKLIITINNQPARQSEIIIVDLENKQYQEYDGMDVPSYPNGIEGETVYLTYFQNETAIMMDLNLNTEQTTFNYNLPYEDNVDGDYGLMSRLRDGSRAIGVNNDNNVLKIIRVPTNEVLLEVPVFPTSFVIKEDGVVYSVETGGKYYSTFDGETKILQLEPNENNVPVDQSSIVAASENLDSLWIKHVSQGGERYYINYVLLKGARTKNARNWGGQMQR